MPIKKVTYRKDKAVLVRVYVEKPRKKSSSSVQHHHHHHYHIHQTLRQEVVHVPPRQGYDRRAGLLAYSHLLRQSARGASSTPLLSKWFANNNLRCLPSSKTYEEKAPSKKKAKDAAKPACFVNWKLLIPSFLRSWSSTRNKKKKRAFDKVRRRGGFFPNMFSTTGKRA